MIKSFVFKTNQRSVYSSKNNFFTSRNSRINFDDRGRVSVSKLIGLIGVNKIFKVTFEELPVKSIEEGEYKLKKEVKK